uniref:MATH domain-containing protein n=1 Tax=Strongyloides venezuelensis TaxID=75913 RepID=A0A0K0FYV7_STRVS
MSSGYSLGGDIHASYGDEFSEDSAGYSNFLNKKCEFGKNGNLPNFADVVFPVVGDIYDRLNSIEDKFLRLSNMIKANNSFSEERFSLLSQEILCIEKQLKQLSKVNNSGGSVDNAGGSLVNRVKNNSFDETVEKNCITRCSLYAVKIYVPEDEQFRHLFKYQLLICNVVSCEIDKKWYVILRTDLISCSGERFWLDDPAVTIISVNVGG